MHAALVTLAIDPAQAQAAAGALMSDILPRLTATPGFVGGHWLEPKGGEGFAMLLFDTEEQARGAVPPAAGWSAPGVTIHTVDIRRVAVSVP